MSLCNLVDVYRLFGWTYCLQFQSRRVRRANSSAASVTGYTASNAESHPHEVLKVSKLGFLNVEAMLDIFLNLW
jgi:hypothetical protein